MKRLARLLAASSALLLAACNSTRIEDSWRDPSVSRIAYQKLFLAVAAPSEAGRRIAEESIRDAMPNTQVVTSYSVLSSAELADLNRLKKAVADSGSDGLALVRFISDKQELGYTPGMTSPYLTLGGYWGAHGRYGTTVVASAPAPTVDRVVLVEVSLYDVKTEKLQWSGTIESFNPGPAAELGAEIAETVGKKLRKEGLVP